MQPETCTECVRLRQEIEELKLKLAQYQHDVIQVASARGCVSFDNLSSLSNRPDDHAVRTGGVPTPQPSCTHSASAIPSDNTTQDGQTLPSPPGLAEGKASATAWPAGAWNGVEHGLSKEKIARYSRQIILPSFGVQGDSRTLGFSTRALLTNSGGLRPTGSMSLMGPTDPGPNWRRVPPQTSGRARQPDRPSHARASSLPVKCRTVFSAASRHATNVLSASPHLPALGLKRPANPVPGRDDVIKVYWVEKNTNVLARRGPLAVARSANPKP
jgi:hypothetical protein